VNAPKDVGLHREEIYQRIQREKLMKLEAALKGQGHAEDKDSSSKGNRSHSSDSDFDDDENQ
jgi:sRNA-binding carbon storage regulator CsrA